MFTITRNWRDVKPPVGAQIHFDNPLTIGLSGCFLLNSGNNSRVVNLLTDKYNRPASTSGVKYIFDGLDFNASSTSYITTSSITKSNTLTSSLPLSIVGMYKARTVGTNSAGIIVGKLNASAQGSKLFTTDTQSLTFWENGTANLQQSSANNLFPYGRRHLFAVTHLGGLNASDCHIYKNGVEVTYASSQNGSAIVDNSASSINFGGQSNGFRMFDGTLYFLYLYTRALGDNEIQALHENPYQFIKPSSRTFFSSGGTSAPVVSSGWQYVTQLSTMGCG